ncbi:MAG TPA: DUF4402 domain-containing protein [Candidatus Krumholzibacteria bacterium]|nr:DUF4402 domain-containing protein [Candidatus Krumholzibacteria bacterium]HRX50882.1 DUF4402 domain-containing protein [Candidatus Krumholzibacteria bacterium]
MRKFFTLTLLALTIMPMAALALDSAQDGKVDVLVALSVAETVELDFGAVADADGTVTLDLTDTIASDPGNIHQGGTVASGVYTITGSASTLVDVDIAAANANGLLLSNFTTNAGAGTFPLVGVSTDGTGALALTLGADLQVQSGVAAAGSNQSLNFTLTVTYN